MIKQSTHQTSKFYRQSEQGIDCGLARAYLDYDSRYNGGAT